MAANHVIDRPSSVIVYSDSAKTVKAAETDYNYDSPVGNTTTGIVQHSAGCNCGSLTSEVHWVSSSGPTLTTTYTNDDTGQRISMTDPRGNQTSYSYSDSYSSGTPPGPTNAYLTKITQPQTNGVNHIESFKYAYASGEVTSSTDQNSQVTNYKYNDNLARLTETDFPDNGVTTIAYNDSPYNPSTPSPSVTTTEAMTSSTNFATLAAFDGLGHTVRSVLTSDPDCSSGDRTDTTFDGLGRGYTVSNPYCTTSDPTYGLTTYVYDALGRTTQVTHPDNSTILTTYTGRATQVQDEGNGNGSRRVSRISQVDGLGRLASVCEVTSASQLGSSGTPAACPQDISATGFLTTYGYDALNDLTSSSQSGLNSRTFQYDSLSRLTSATNPESGTMTYSYDSNGNLITKTDARGITTCFGNWNGTSCDGSGYDALNRVTQKTYSDGTLTAYFAYEQTSAWGATLTNTVGRLTEQWTGTSCCATGGAEIFSYDQMGRPLLNEQYTPAMSYAPVNYTYDLAGNMASFTNGGGETFNYTTNGAARLTTLTSSLSDSNHPGTLFSAARYNAAGSMLTASLGRVITETRTYDSRLRLASISDGSNYSLTIPSSGGYAPNGDILAANDSVNGDWTYSYDDFNRLSGSNQNSGQSVYSYAYDRFGNRWQQNGPYSMELSFSGANNRMDGYSYDAAGNLLSDGSHSYTYDAENRITQVDGGSTAAYAYDAEGRRVQKTTPSGTASYIYDLAGHEVVQYGPTCSPCRDEIYVGARHLATYNNGTTYFIHPDWLGTERARSNVTGGVCETITSLPFGDDMNTSGSCSDASPMHFTGKERDTESGLDNFGARFNSSNFGRFTSPDPGNAGTVNDDPQSWNAYSYVRNNPINLTDPKGANFCRAAGAGDPEGVTLVCDVSDSEYVNSSKDQQAAYDEAGYKHYNCSCDTDTDKAAWAERNGNVSSDFIGDGLVFVAALAGLEGFFYPRLHPDSGSRFPQDIERQNDYPNPPPANNGNSPIGNNPNQAAEVARDRAEMERQGFRDIRQNQEQVNAQGVRVGRNKPDLQGTDPQTGIRHYIEYDQDPASGAAHKQRILANDPAGEVTTKNIK